VLVLVLVLKLCPQCWGLMVVPVPPLLTCVLPWQAVVCLLGWAQASWVVWDWFCFVVLVVLATVAVAVAVLAAISVALSALGVVLAVLASVLVLASAAVVVVVLVLALIAVAMLALAVVLAVLLGVALVLVLVLVLALAQRVVLVVVVALALVLGAMQLEPPAAGLTPARSTPSKTRPRASPSWPVLLQGAYGTSTPPVSLALSTLGSTICTLL
jgi:hypothetical protein